MRPAGAYFDVNYKSWPASRAVSSFSKQSNSVAYTSPSLNLSTLEIFEDYSLLQAPELRFAYRYC